MRRAKLVLALAAVMVAMMLAVAAPALANDKNERNDQDRTDIFHDGNRNDIFDDGNRNDIFDENAFFLFPFFAIEEIDIDCDGEDDDWDGGIDEGADCE